MAQRLTNNPGLTLPYTECCKVDQSKYVPCPQCGVWYCSPDCRDKAWAQYHRTLCMGASREDPAHPLAQLIETWRSFHYPPETTSIMLLLKIIATIKQAEDKGAALADLAGFVSSAVNREEHIAHKLLGEKFKAQKEVLREQLMATFFEESIHHWYTAEGFNSMIALIGTNGQGIGSSSISKWVSETDELELQGEAKDQLEAFIDSLYVDMQEVSGQFIDCEGSGLYKLQSACNHSCDPNAEISFVHGNHTLSIVALRDISPEEEICISYLDCCDQERGRHSRQKTLRENYLFHCRCEKCLSQADDESVTSEDDMDDDEFEPEIGEGDDECV